MSCHSPLAPSPPRPRRRWRRPQCVNHAPPRRARVAAHQYRSVIPCVPLVNGKNIPTFQQKDDWLKLKLRAPSLLFTTFPGTPPSPYVLNSNKNTHKPQIRHINPRCAPPTPDADAAYYYFSVDNQLVYLSFFKDWGPLNLAMVYKACLLIHELLEVCHAYLCFLLEAHVSDHRMTDSKTIGLCCTHQMIHGKKQTLRC